MKSLSPNTLLQNRYLIVQLIGKGGMGEVYLAVDQRLGSAVALKRTFFTDDEMLRSAFEREAKTLARLRHPVLPKVSDHFIENDNQYLVMDHISGDDLSKRLESAKKPFPLNWVLFWADQLLDALNYLHSYSPPIVHRDIKPQNLKLTDDNHIVLLDFGLAKDNVGETRTTSSGSVVGFTPHYAPMEQIRGIGTNPKSDLYSLSATLYQLLTNTVPPDALSRADLLVGKMPDPLIPLSELNPEVSSLISDIIAKGMAVSLDQRPSSARAMQKLLRDGYAQMQNAMSAQTMAFTLKAEESKVEELEQPETALPTDENLDPFITLVNEKPFVENQNSTSIGDKTEQMDFADIAKIKGDAAPPEDVSEPQQSEAKTEVFLAGSGILPTLEEGSADDLDVAENFDSASEEIADDSEFITTIPLVSYGNDEADSIVPEAPTAFDSVQTSLESDEEDYGFSSGEDFSDVEEIYTDSDSNTEDAGYEQTDYDAVENDFAENYKERISPPPPPKKSGGNTALIAGGLFLLLFLIVGAAGAGLYLYNNSDDAVNQPQPTPETVPSALPTPEPMADVANTDDTANTDVTLSDNINTEEIGVGETNSQPTNSAVITNTTTANPPLRTPVKPPPVPPKKPETPAEQPRTPKKPQTPANPPKKPPTPKKDDRTVPLP